MSSGNTLLAHAVGAGKSLEMAATAMKMRQAGLIKKPMIVVPNHLLEQFAREFQQGYPNAHLLVASKEDFTRDRRKLLTAKIATARIREQTGAIPEPAPETDVVVPADPPSAVVDAAAHPENGLHSARVLAGRTDKANFRPTGPKPRQRVLF
jgi:hypothetical protein